MVFLAVVLAWNQLFAFAGIVFTAWIVAARDPRLSLPEEAREHWLKGFLGWAGTWKVIPLVLFVLTYKLGEFAIGPMVKPFWVDYGKSIWPLQDDLMFQIGLSPTTFGIVLSILGALLGGTFISRFGIFHAVWFLGLLQAVSNLGYSFVDWMDLGRFGLYGASMFESLSGGLGTAAFLAFLMNICQKEHATIQYAFLSSIFSLTGRLIGGISGLGAERYGLAITLRSLFFVDACLSFAAVGEAVDSRRAAEMSRSTQRIFFLESAAFVWANFTEQTAPRVELAFGAD